MFSRFDPQFKSLAVDHPHRLIAPQRHIGAGAPDLAVHPDAAGFAEMKFGAGRDRKGLVMILTLGTGIGSALFMDGRLVPNCELGHLYLPGHTVDAEDYASDRIRAAEDLGWKTWARRLDIYLRHLEGLFSPNLFILGGGVSKKSRRFVPHLSVRTEVVPALLHNEAGIIGAAMAAVDEGSSADRR